MDERNRSGRNRNGAAANGMKLADLVRDLPVRISRGTSDIVISEIVEDSRLAKRGCLFVARGGTKSDGKKFIADAVRLGAIAVLTDDANAVADDVTTLVCDEVRLASSQMIERFFGHPSQSLRLIGITGTNGKTTTAYLVRHLLNGAAIRCGLIGTVQIDDGKGLTPAELTTPPAVELGRLMRAMVDNGCVACVMETSSHALHQKRTAGLHFQIGVFTNLSGDHLDYHKTMDEYRDAKAILFESLPANGTAIVNIDDPAADAMARHTPANVITCAIQTPGAMCRAAVIEQTLSGMQCVFDAPEMWGTFECRVPLIGRHNAMNALQALAVGHAMGLDRDALIEGITTCKAPPGRLEPVTTGNDDFAVLVDYAHTDDALENVLRALRPIVPAGGKLRAVFGCGGDRDRTKRPRMAKVACRYADDVIITSDNPRTEDPQSIIDEIKSGVPHDKLHGVMCIVDREKAIRAAIMRVRDGDILLIAGKGHEDYQIIGTTKRAFDDRKIASSALSQRNMKVAV